MKQIKLWLIREQLRNLFSYQKETTIFERRNQYEKYVGKFPVAEDVEISDDTHAGHTMRWLRPTGSVSEKVILYFHGGSMCMGSVVSHTPLASQLCAKTQIPVCMPEYRLAPENPFPNAIDDAIYAYKYLLSNGSDHDDIAICADSAGALLALNVALYAREKALPMPSCLSFLAPAVCLDLLPDDKSYLDLDDRDPVLSIHDMRRYTHAYLGKTKPDNPQASPLYNDFKGMPPIMSVVGSEEMIVEQVRQMHMACFKSGVHSELIIQPGCFHGHYLLYALLPEGMSAIDEVASFIINSHKAQDSSTV